ncbi:MAG: hypothetical protein ABIE68_03530 [bacterium]
MSTWIDEFRALCVVMHAKCEVDRDLPERGRIHWNSELMCEACGSTGVFIGYDLEYGEFYECAMACYCPFCKQISNARIGINFAPYGSHRFLPIMKRKLIANLESAPVKMNKEPCSFCGGPTYRFIKDLGAVDFYDNTWTVCINPDCDWPGSHHESIESSY